MGARSRRFELPPSQPTPGQRTEAAYAVGREKSSVCSHWLLGVRRLVSRVKAPPSCFPSLPPPWARLWSSCLPAIPSPLTTHSHNAPHRRTLRDSRGKGVRTRKEAMEAEPAASWKGFLASSVARMRGHPCCPSIIERGPFKLRVGFSGEECEETADPTRWEKPSTCPGLAQWGHSGGAAPTPQALNCSPKSPQVPRRGHMAPGLAAQEPGWPSSPGRASRSLVPQPPSPLAQQFG